VAPALPGSSTAQAAQPTIASQMPTTVVSTTQPAIVQSIDSIGSTTSSTSKSAVTTATTFATQAPPTPQVATTTTTNATVQPVTIATGNGTSTPTVIIVKHPEAVRSYKGTTNWQNFQQHFERCARVNH